MKKLFERIAIVPFEAAVGVLVLVSGLTGLFHIGLIDPVNQLLPTWEASTFNAAFFICGVFLISGIFLASAAIESVGLWLLNSTIVARFILYGYYLHYGKDFFLTGIFDLAIIAAGFVRLQTVNTQHVILKVKDGDVSNILK